MTATDIDGVVRVHLAAFQGFFLTFLGADFLRVYYRCIVDFGQIGFVLEREGAVIGFVTGIENGVGFYRHALLNHGHRFGLAAIPALLRDPRRVLPRLARAVFKKPSGAPVKGPARASSLTSIAVLPDPENRGLGRELIAAYKGECTKRGLQRIYLETDAEGNDHVLRFYEREGFRQCRTYTTAEGRRLHEFSLDL